MISHALLWTARWIAIALILQTVEMLQLKDSYADDGVWAWPVIRDDFAAWPAPLRKALDAVMAPRAFKVFLRMRLAAAALLFVWPHPAVVLFLLAGTLLIGARWRGVFNGGSDAMTVVVLTGLTISACGGASLTASRAGLWYIAVQSCLSYFVSGLVKLKAADWRSGRALTLFLTSSLQAVPPRVQKLVSRRTGALAAAWTVIIFECGFPLAVTSPLACMVFLLSSFAFHMANFWLFGLNRFLFAWISTYPALIYAEKIIRQL